MVDGRRTTEMLWVRLAVAAVAVALAGAATITTPSADAATLVVGRGSSAVEVRRPGTHVDAWAYTTLSASAQRPQGTVLAWTEVTETTTPRRWWWKTYTSWCSAGRCSRPVEALRSKRSARKTPEDSVTPWQVYVNADPTRDRAVVKAGIRWGSRWAITSRRGLVGRGPTDNVWIAGFIGITHTPDGRDWLSWNNDHEQIRISQARNGHRLGGPVVARGDTAQVRAIGGRWVVLSLGRTNDEDSPYPVNLKTAPTIAGLRTATTTRLARHGFDAFLELFGPDSGPLLAVWQTNADSDLAEPVRSSWIDQAGALSAPQVLPGNSLDVASLRSVSTPAGGLTVCPWNLTATLGGAFQKLSGACTEGDVRPVRLQDQ